MKKILMIIISFMSIQTAFADDTANVKINITGASSSDNRYYLCLPDVGCMSIRAGDAGKVYPILRPIDMNEMYVADADQGYQISPQGLPASCNTTVETGKTITISGNMVGGADGTVHVNGLHCNVT